MESKDIKAAVALSGKNLTTLSSEIGLSVQNLTQKMKRESLTKNELEAVAASVGAKYKCFFEFPDGTKIGKF